MHWRPLSIYFLLLTVSFIAHGGDLAEECDLLARDRSFGFQCHKKPLVMWQACMASCVKYAQDLHPNCAQWASEGRCEKNARYMQIHCAPSCGMAVAWNPLTRQALGLAELSNEVDTLLEQVFCPGDVRTVATLFRQRLRRLVEGDGNTLHALQATFHSPIHSLVGLAETCLYVIRLYDIVLQQTAPESSAAARELAQRLEATIQVTLRSLDVDLITRSLRPWIAQLDSLHTLVIPLQSEGASPRGRLIADPDDTTRLSPLDLPYALHPLCNRTAHSTLPRCQSDWEADAYDAYHANLAAAAESGDVTSPVPTLPTHRTLQNGLRMPVLGVYLHSLDMIDAETLAMNALSLGCQLFLVSLDSPDMLAALASALTLARVPRKNVFLAAHFSEASLSHPDTPTVAALVQRTLQQSGWGAGLDLLLLDGPCHDRASQLRVWTDMQTLYHASRVRSLGISNFDLHSVHALIQQLQAAQTAQPKQAWVQPMVVAGKYDVYHAHKQLDEEGVDVAAQLQAWLPGVHLLGLGVLSGYPFALRPLADPIVRAVACDHTQRVAEVMNQYDAWPEGATANSAGMTNYSSLLGADIQGEEDWTDGYYDGEGMGMGEEGGGGLFGEGLAGGHVGLAAGVGMAGDWDELEDAVRQTEGLGIPWDHDATNPPADSSTPSSSSPSSSTQAPSFTSRTTMEGISTAQVLLRHALEQGMGTVFQTGDLQHLEQNLHALYMIPLTQRQKRVLEILPLLSSSTVTRSHPLH